MPRWFPRAPWSYSYRRTCTSVAALDGQLGGRPIWIVDSSQTCSQIRPLSSSDYGRGHLSPLADLTSTPDIGANAWAKRYNLLKSMSNMYYILVIVDGDTDKILATGTLVLEYKFIRGAGSVGHIEDIAVSKSAQGKKLGLHLVKALTQLSEKVGCYKSILDCGEDNKGE